VQAQFFTDWRDELSTLRADERKPDGLLKQMVQESA